MARASGAPQNYPVKTRKLKRSHRENALLLLQRGAEVFLVQRPQKGVWAGLWSLPEHAGVQALEGWIAGSAGQGDWLPTIQHALTHFDWTLHTLAWRLPPAAALPAALPEGRWVHREAALLLGLPTPVRRLLDDPVSRRGTGSAGPLTDGPLGG
jgi:A/G-specific adenine glycosylase